MKYIKLFEEYTPSHFSYGGVFKDSSAEEMRRIAGGNLPEELENIKKKFSGKSLNFGITEDGGKFKVYQWSSISKPILVGEYENLKDAEQAVLDNDK
jgi:hypothetical protein